MHAYRTAIAHYFDFTGRMSRRDFWTFFFYALVLITAAVFVDVNLANGRRDAVPVVFTLAMLFHVVPSLSAQARRFHDTDRSGWWTLVALVPVVGQVIFFVFLCQGSTPGPNRFGPNPTDDGDAADRLTGAPQGLAGGRERMVGTVDAAGNEPAYAGRHEPGLRDDRQPTVSAEVAPQSATTPSISGDVFPYEQLEKAAALRASGAITDEEFAQMKAKLLGR